MIHKSTATLFLALSSSLLAAVGFSKTIKDQWIDTGLKFSDFALDITNSRCTISEKSFVACLEGLNAAVNYRRNGMLLVAQDAITDQKRYTKVGIQFGGLELVQIIETKPSTLLSQKKIIEKQLIEARRLRDGLRSLYRQGPLLWPEFAEILQYIDAHVVSQIPNESGAIAGEAFNAKLEIEFDPHTILAPKPQFVPSNDTKTQVTDVVGVGIIAEKIGDIILVKAVKVDSPASKAGILQDDVLLKINSVDLSGMELESVATLIQGPDGSTVLLTIQRDGEEFTTEVVRRKVTYSSSEVRLIPLGSGVTQALYLRLKDFRSDKIPPVQDDAPGCKLIVQKIKGILQEAGSPQISEVILDLRGNPGGYTTEAVCIAGLFLKKNSLVAYLKPFYGMTQEIRTHEEFKLWPENLKAVVMVDGRSASASELVASALQDHQKAYVVGTRTFGKGSFQEVKSWSRNPRIQMSLTKGLYYRVAQHTSVQLQGVTPDIEVSKSPNPSQYEEFYAREDMLYAEPIDPKLPLWIQPAAEEITKVKTCVDSQGTAAKKHAQSKIDPSINLDYHLNYALDVSLCVP